MFVCIKESFLPFMLQSCITTINSLFTIGFEILNSVKSTSGKLYRFIVTKNIYFIYIYMYIYMCIYIYIHTHTHIYIYIYIYMIETY